MLAYTDYPIQLLGDENGKVAPIRKVEVLSYDTNKYCIVYVNGVLVEIKAGYLYMQKKRLQDNPMVIDTSLLDQQPLGLIGLIVEGNPNSIINPIKYEDF